MGRLGATLLTEVDGGSAAERAGMHDFIGRRLTHVNGALVQDVLHAVRAAQGARELTLLFEAVQLSPLRPPGAAYADPSSAAAAAGGGDGDGAWACSGCTFLNAAPLLRCELCESARPDPVGVPKSESALVAEATGTSVEMARRAIDAAGGDAHQAVANLLVNPLNPSGRSPLEAAVDPRVSELREFGGITAELARRHLEESGGDMKEAKRRVLEAILSADGAQDIDIRGDLREPLRRNTAEFDCPSCLCPAAPGEGVALRLCGHKFCADCAAGHIRERMADGANGLIPCLQPGCMHTFTHRELRALMGTACFGALDRRALEAAAAEDPTLHLCPTPDCTYIVSWAGERDGPPSCRCPVCKHSTCLACGARPFHDDETCAQHQERKEAERKARRDRRDVAKRSEAEERATREFFAKSNIRICRRCGVPIVKGHGCLKMKCRCGYRFCYHCGSENAQCGCTPSNHGFWDNNTDAGDFTRLQQRTSGT